VQDKAEKVLGYFGQNLHDAETRSLAHDRELLGIQDAISYCKFNLHGANQPFLVHMDLATMHLFFTQPHLTVRKMDIVTVVHDSEWEVKHLPSVKNHVINVASLSGFPTGAIPLNGTGSH